MLIWKEGFSGVKGEREGEEVEGWGINFNLYLCDILYLLKFLYMGFDFIFMLFCEVKLGKVLFFFYKE